jgi:DNA-binding CsgD family transcriptional regulator
MHLSLKPSQLDRLTKLVETLHAPFDFPDLDSWRHAVNHHARLLLDAHKVVFMMPGPGHEPVYSQRLDPGAFRAYVAFYHRFDVAGRLALQRRIPVSSEVELHGRDAYYASEYYNDFMRVWQCHHSTGMVAPMEAEPGYAWLAVYRDSRDDPVFGPRARGLMKLILPSFHAGVRTYLRLAADRAVLASVIDASGKRILLCDPLGKPLHASAALEQTLAADPERSALEGHMRELARSVGALTTNTSAATASIGKTGERTVVTLRGRYRLTASLAGEPSPAPAGVLVLLEPLFHQPLSDGELRERFHLTKQEIRVARLIAEELRNDAIAHRLDISPHTARRHTERVLEKLGIASRAQVADRISPI